MTDPVNPVVPKLRVLVVDDDATSTDLFCEIVEMEGMQAVALTDSKKVHSMLDPAPDLIILDLFMPDVDGIDILRDLKERHCTAGVILVTGGDKRLLAAAAELARRTGVRVLGTLAKPVAREVLGALLRKHGAAGATA